MKGIICVSDEVCDLVHAIKKLGYRTGDIDTIEEMTETMFAFMSDVLFGATLKAAYGGMTEAEKERHNDEIVTATEGINEITDHAKQIYEKYGLPLDDDYRRTKEGLIDSLLAFWSAEEEEEEEEDETENENV